jgi:hypothetical protein
MQPSLPGEPADRNIKTADVAASAEVAKLVGTETQMDAQNRCGAGVAGAAN